MFEIFKAKFEAVVSQTRLAAATDSAQIFIASTVHRCQNAFCFSGGSASDNGSASAFLFLQESNACRLVGRRSFFVLHSSMLPHLDGETEILGQWSILQSQFVNALFLGNISTVQCKSLVLLCCLQGRFGSHRHFPDSSMYCPDSATPENQDFYVFLFFCLTASCAQLDTIR